MHPCDRLIDHCTCMYVMWYNSSHCLKLRSSSPDTYVRMQADAQKRFGELHKDLAACDLLPVNVLIVGGKFDTFKDRER